MGDIACNMPPSPTARFKVPKKASDVDLLRLAEVVVTLQGQIEGFGEVTDTIKQKQNDLELKVKKQKKKFKLLDLDLGKSYYNRYSVL